MSIESYMINQIRENLAWLVQHTDVFWEVTYDPRDSNREGISFKNYGGEITVIWSDEV